MTLSTSLVAVWYSSNSCRSRGALAQFGEQPRILHRDHRLRREVLQQRDLLVGERPHLLAIERDDAEHAIVLAQRHHQARCGRRRDRPARAVAGRRSDRLLGRQIGDMDDALAVQQARRLLCRARNRARCGRAIFGKRRRHARASPPCEIAVVIEGPRAAPKAASHRRIAFSSIASNTGARSPGEELMTCSTSAVAVCCSSASRVSVISRAFSIAMTACAAKFCNSAICLSENGRTSWR